MPTAKHPYYSRLEKAIQQGRISQGLLAELEKSLAPLEPVVPVLTPPPEIEEIPSVPYRLLTAPGKLETIVPQATYATPEQVALLKRFRQEGTLGQKFLTEP